MKNEQNHRIANYAEKSGEVVLRPHEFDGIQEFDQKMPNWWLFLFYGAIGFFLVWWLAYYQFGLMQPDTERVDGEMRQVEKRKADALAALLSTLNDDLLVNQFAADPAVVALGQTTYMTLCTGCHGPDLTASMDLGGGKLAPMTGLSLKDGEWKYGSHPMDIFKLINEGTPADQPGHNGARMAAWGQVMPPMQIVELVSFIISENPKEFPPKVN